MCEFKYLVGKKIELKKNYPENNLTGKIIL